jgi:hypothetical protein
MRNLLTLVGIGTIAAIGLSSAPAQAFSVTTSSGLTSSTPGVTSTIDFNSGSLPANYSGGGVVSGSVPAQYAAPAGVTTSYLSLGGSAQPSPVTIALGGLYDYFGLYWGSVDGYNSIQFLNAGTAIASFTGSQIPGVSTDGTQSSYVNFLAGAGEAFDTIVLRSDIAAFESDNHSFRAVPTPALLPGLLALGASLRRKRQQAAAAE